MLLIALFQMICSKWPMLEYSFFHVVCVVLFNCLATVYSNKSICVSFSAYKLDFVSCLMPLYRCVWRHTFINIVDFRKFILRCCPFVFALEVFLFFDVHSAVLVQFHSEILIPGVGSSKVWKQFLWL